MAADLATAERALRRAHEAGDVEAARTIARGIREMQAAPAEGGGWMDTAFDVASSVAFPHRMIGEAVMGQAERAGEQLTSLPGQAADFLTDALATSGTHYRTLAHGVGLPVDPPTEEASDEYQQAVIEALLTAGGGAGGRMLGTAGLEILKRAGRGFRTRAGTERFLTREGAHAVPAGQPKTTSVMSELSAPAVTGSGVAIGVDMLDPTPYEFTDKPVAGGAGVAAAAIAHREAMDNLLLQNPRYRDLVMRGGGRAPIGTAIGAALGYLASKGIEGSAELVDDVVSFFTGGGEPEPSQQARRLPGGGLEMALPALPARRPGS